MGLRLSFELLRLCLVVLWTFILPVNGIHVKLFRDLNYKGLIYEYKEALATCHNVDDYATGEIGSVFTDTCLMLYEGRSCLGPSFKLSRDLPELSDLRRNVSSFHPCNEVYGSTKIRLDMYDDTKLIAEYRDICGCQDLPSQVSTNLIQLNNYGNCIAVYSTDTCSGNKTEVPGGQNGLTSYLPQLGYYVRSVSACGVRHSCVRLKFTIFKFKLIPNPSQAKKESSAQNVDLGTKTYFYNNGSAILTQEYEARKTVRESTTMKMSRTVSSSSEFKMDGAFDVEVETGQDGEDGGEDGGGDDDEKDEDEDLVIKLKGKLSGSLDVAYSTESPPQTTDYSYTHEEENEFVVKQSFRVPPCTQYEVSSTVKMVEDYPVIYELYARVTAESSGRRMSAQEVATQVDEMTFVEYYDEYTAIFKQTETMSANLGVETVISGEGSWLPGCDKR